MNDGLRRQCYILLVASYGVSVVEVEVVVGRKSEAPLDRYALLSREFA
jgi:hypothetical protein